MRLIALLLCCLTALGGCKKMESPKPPQILRVGIARDPESLDPHLHYYVETGNIVLSLMEGLVAPDPKDASAVLPGVAHKWECSADGLTWTFYLRDNAAWTNGEPVTAHDFVFSFKRLLSPKLGAQYANYFYMIRAAKSYHLGQSSDFESVGVRAQDEHTLILELDYPAVYLLDLLAKSFACPVNKKTLLAHGDPESRANTWSTPDHYVGNGAFILEKQVPYEITALKKNPHYWDCAAVKLEEIRFLPFEDRYAQERAFRVGQLDLTSQMPVSLIAGYLRDHNPQLQITHLAATAFIACNTRVAPTNDVNFRRALSLSLDRRALTQRVTLAGELPSERFTPPAIFKDYHPKIALEFNPKKAKDLIDQHSLEESSVELFYDSAHTIPLQVAIHSMWEETLGIQCALVQRESKVFLEQTNRGDFSLARFSWMAAYLDPLALLSLFETGNPNNCTGWTNAQYDALLEKARQAIDKKEHLSLLAQAEDILMSELPIIPICTATRAQLKSPRVHGWYKTPLEFRLFKEVWIE